MFVILQSLKDKSEFKTAIREDWDDQQYMWAGILNEIRILRADQVALHSQQKMEPVLLKSPREQAAEDEKAQQHQALRTGILAQLHGAKSPGT